MTTSLGGSLRESRRDSGGAGSRRVRNTLVAVEVALAVVLLVGASLAIRSFERLTRVSPGFDPRGILTFTLSLPDGVYKEDRRCRRSTPTSWTGWPRSRRGVERRGHDGAGFDERVRRHLLDRRSGRVQRPGRTPGADAADHARLLPHARHPDRPRPRVRRPRRRRRAAGGDRQRNGRAPLLAGREPDRPAPPDARQRDPRTAVVPRDRRHRRAT